MASSYSIEDQAADLGIHRIHSLVLGDARREARIAARLSPHTPKRGVLGRGDSKHEDQDYESLQKHELSRIARRQNLMSVDSKYQDADTLTSKIAAWKTLKVEHVIRRPDGLGTGNAHRGGPNYRPIALFGQPKRPPPLHPRAVQYAAPGTSSFAARKYLIPAPGAVAAAWQAVATGKPFHPFGLPDTTSSVSVGHVPVKPPVRVPTKKSTVGSPRPKATALPAEAKVTEGTYVDRVEPRPGLDRSRSPELRHDGSRYQIADVKIRNDTSSQGSREFGATYADQMQAFQSKIRSDHDPLKCIENVFPKKSPEKTPVQPIPRRMEEPSMWSVKSPVCQASHQRPDGSRWTGKLATAKDPYFNQPPTHPSPSVIPVVSPQAIPTRESSGSSTEPAAANGENTQNIPATTTTKPAPDISSISLASAVLDIADYLELLDDAEDEDEEQRYDADPDRVHRDLEINLRVNKSIAEAEEDDLAHEILSPRTGERKTVEFVESANVVHEPVSNPALGGEVDVGRLQVLTKALDVWDSFRDFVTMRTVTGFEEWVPVPRGLRGKDFVEVDTAEELEVRVADMEKGKSEKLGQTEAKDEETEGPPPPPPPPELEDSTDNGDIEFRVGPRLAGEIVRQSQKYHSDPVQPHDLPSASDDAQAGPFATDIQIQNDSGIMTTYEWVSSSGFPERAQQDSTPRPGLDSPPQIVPPAAPIETTKIPHSVHALNQTKPPASPAQLDPPPPAQPLKTTPTYPVRPPTPVPMATKIPSKVTKINLPFTIQPSNTVARRKPPPANVMNEFESSEVANTWTKPIPLARVGLVDQASYSYEIDNVANAAAASDEFLLGLDEATKVEPARKVVSFDTKSEVDIAERKGDEIVGKEAAEIGEKKAVTPRPDVHAQAAPPPPSHGLPAPAPMVPSPAKEVYTKPKDSVPLIPSTSFYSSMAGPIPSLSRPMISSPPLSTTPPTFRSPRSGIPMPIPVPPTPRPARKSPPKKVVLPSISSPSATIEPRPPPSHGSAAKPAVAPKPANLATASKKGSLISPLVGGLVDPFLQGLEPKAKKDKSGPLPQRPGGSTSHSTESSPSTSFDSKSSAGVVGGDEVSADLSGSGTTDLSHAWACSTSLSGSWTLVENSKGSPPEKETPLPPPPATAPNDAPAPVVQPKQFPPSAPMRRTWFSSEPSPTPAPTPAPSPSATPTVTPNIHAALPSFVKPMAKPTIKAAAPAPRKLFTFELKVGETVVSTPVYETDNPTVVAREFVRKHDFESQLPGGKDTVNKIVSCFENQFAERKQEREKRRAERRMKNSLN